MKKIFFLAWLLPCSVLFGASVPFTAFNPNQFEAQPTGGPGPYVAVKNGVALTNLYMPEETPFTFAYFDATNGLHSSGILTNAVGGAFNPTDTFVPYRSNSTTWADSPVAIPSNTQVLLTNGASLNFGDLTSSSPMITNTSTLFRLRKADNSDWAALSLGDLTINQRTFLVTPESSYAGAGPQPGVVSATSTMRRILGLTNSVTLTSTPTIADGSAGQIFFVVGGGNVTNVITLQSESALPGSNLTLGSATRTLQLGETLGLQFDNTDGTWHEMFYSGTGTGDNWTASGTTNSTLAGVASVHALVATNSISSGAAGTAGVVTVYDTDASNSASFSANPVTTTDVNIEMPAAPFSGLVKSTITSVTNMVISQASSSTDYVSPSVNSTLTPNGALSSPGLQGTGTWITGGSATTTKPYWLIEPSGTTSTAWSTAGTGLGINAASGFTGNLIDLQLNGVTKASILAATGTLTLAGNISLANTSTLSWAGRDAIASPANGQLQLYASGFSQVIWINNYASDSIILGQNAVASPAAQLIRGPTGTGTDKVGGDIILGGGVPTGAGTRGVVKGRNAFTTTTGSTTNAYTSDYVFGGTLKVNTTATGNVGGGEDDLITYSVPANQLGFNTDYLEFDVWGTTAANANTKQIKIVYGATTLIDGGAAVLNGLSWRAHGKIVRTGAATQTATCELTVGGTLLSGVNGTISLTTSPTETLSGAITFKVTGTSAVAPADNDIVQNGMVLKYHPGQ